MERCESAETHLFPVWQCPEHPNPDVNERWEMNQPHISKIKWSTFSTKPETGCIHENIWIRFYLYANRWPRLHSGLFALSASSVLSLAPLSPHRAQYILNARWTLIRVNEKMLLCRERMERATERFCLTSQTLELPLQEMWTREYKKRTERSQGDEMSRADKKDKGKRYFREAVDEQRREERMGEMNRFIFSGEYSQPTQSREHTWVFNLCEQGNNYICAG